MHGPAGAPRPARLYRLAGRCGHQRGRHAPQLDRPPHVLSLRARNQWTYAARLYRAGLWACEADHGNARVELVQLTSFGCGIDAITADQMRELMRAHGKLYTLIHMDEGNALASARIRIRSLLAVSRTRSGDSTATSVSHAPPIFSKRDATTHTILVPQMAPLHFPLMTQAIAGSGHTIQLLPTVSAEAVNLGQAYVNNDACYPAIVAIGQLLQALRDDGLDPRRTALLLSQTCGPCRAKAIIRLCCAGRLWNTATTRCPLLTLNASGSESQPGLRPDRALLWRMLLGMLAGDMLQRLSLFTGTCECHAGQTEDRVQHTGCKP